MSFIQFIKSKIFFKQLLIFFIGFVLLIFLLQWWLTIITNHNQKIQVPNLKKMTLANVQKKLKELHLDYIVIDSATYNPSYPKKSVIEQSPKSGNFVKEKRKIYLTLNPSKYRDINIPNLNGKTKRQAITHLQSIGFKVGKNFTYIPDIGKNVVRGLEHNGVKLEVGKKLPKNSLIDLILGDGTPTTTSIPKK